MRTVHDVWPEPLEARPVTGVDEFIVVHAHIIGDASGGRNPARTGRPLSLGGSLW